MRRIFFLQAVLFVFISCSNDEKQTQPKNQTQQNTEQENPNDTNLTPAEKFSSAILLDFLNGSEDEDLAAFLEEEVFKMGVNYSGASVVEVSPSTWLLSLEKNDSNKNFLIQKYVDFKSNEYYLRMKETSLNVTDVISKHTKSSESLQVP